MTIPGSVTRIGTCAFKSCTSLSCVALPEALTEIGGYAFIGCSSLEHVRIPRKVTRIGEGARRSGSAELLEVWRGTRIYIEQSKCLLEDLLCKEYGEV